MVDVDADTPLQTSDAPRVTVVLPVFNAGQYLRLAVLSIIGQTFTDWELLVIDDASTDNAIETIADLVDARIRIIRNAANIGLAATLNIGIEQARGRFFARMDQDDVAYPERLARQVALLEENPHIDLCAVRCLAIDARNEVVGALPYAITDEAIRAAPWRGFYLPHPTWMGRLSWFRQHRYAQPGPYLCEDQELLLRGYRASRFATVPEVLFAYRVRDRVNWKKNYKTRKTVWRLQLRHFCHERAWISGLFATLVFIGRVAWDAMNVLVQTAGFRGFYPYLKIHHDDVEHSRWRNVLGRLNSHSENRAQTAGA